ncbi:sugar phosphate isomerase/epimerase [Candidatus Pelagibacter sp.]|nr:sugar phosphate isomerase/epimerase [Candidatus Pelagibacter sp.]
MIYISTGHYRELNAREILTLFEKNKIKNIEFSGGKYSTKLKNLFLKNSDKFKFQIHNYFPPPKKPIVINLSSQNKKVLNDSLKLIKKAIDLTKLFNGQFYSFHAGFLVDLLPKDLGKSKSKFREINFDVGLSTFLKNIEIISRYAQKRNVEILLENNVIGSYNFKRFKKNPFLMADPKSIEYIMKNTPNNVNLLLDVGHLKVSAKTLGFDKNRAHEKVKKWIKAYHISENNGNEDTNSLINNKSWFLKKLKPVSSYTLEVYNSDIDLIKKQVKILNKSLHG